MSVQLGSFVYEPHTQLENSFAIAISFRQSGSLHNFLINYLFFKNFCVCNYVTPAILLRIAKMEGSSVSLPSRIIVFSSN